MKDEDWSPGYEKPNGIFIAYDKSWFCSENKIIHSSLKEKLNCKYCKEI